MTKSYRFLLWCYYNGVDLKRQRNDNTENEKGDDGYDK